MTKEAVKVYIERDIKKKLLLKAQLSNITGRGALSKFLTKLGNENFVWLDSNMELFLSALNKNITLSPNSQ